MDQKVNAAPAKRSELDNILAEAYSRHKPNKTGALADYIPELTRADPEGFGVAIATVGGGRRAERGSQFDRAVGDLDTHESIFGACSTRLITVH